MRTFLFIIIFSFCFTAGYSQVQYTKLDSAVATCDYILVGKIIRSVSWPAPAGVTGRWHAVNMVVERSYRADWKDVAPGVPLLQAGDTLYQLKYHSEGDSMNVESHYFIPLRHRGRSYYFYENKPFNMEVAKDTSLFSEYSQRRNPELHLPVNYFVTERDSLNAVKKEYASDGKTLLSKVEIREVSDKKMRFRYYEYDSSGNVTYYSRGKTVAYKNDSVRTLWVLKRNGKKCLKYVGGMRQRKEIRRRLSEENQ